MPARPNPGTWHAVPRLRPDIEPFGRNRLPATFTNAEGSLRQAFLCVPQLSQLRFNARQQGNGPLPLQRHRGTLGVVFVIRGRIAVSERHFTDFTAQPRDLSTRIFHAGGQ